MPRIGSGRHYCHSPPLGPWCRHPPDWCHTTHHTKAAALLMGPKCIVLQIDDTALVRAEAWGPHSLGVIRQQLCNRRKGHRQTGCDGTREKAKLGKQHKENITHRSTPFSGPHRTVLICKWEHRSHHGKGLRAPFLSSKGAVPGTQTSPLL